MEITNSRIIRCLASFSNPCPPLTPSFFHQPAWPKVDWEPLTEFPHTDVGHRADPEKKSLLSVTTEIDHLSPAIGTRLRGVDLRNLTNTQKDELYAWRLAFGWFTDASLYSLIHLNRALLVAERTVVGESSFHPATCSSRLPILLSSL